MQPDKLRGYESSLEGEQETLSYVKGLSMRFWYNVQYANFSNHWHTALEIVMPLEQKYTVFIQQKEYDVRRLGYDPYNAKEFISRWETENGPFGIEKVIQGAKTESVPLGELKKLSEERMLLFDEELMSFAMGNCIAVEDTNGNRKLMKKRYEQKIDAVAAMMDAYIAYKINREAFD